MKLRGNKMEQEIELLKAKIKVLELEIELLKAKQNQGWVIVNPIVEPYNPLSAKSVLSVLSLYNYLRIP